MSSLRQTELRISCSHNACVRAVPFLPSRFNLTHRSRARSDNPTLSPDSSTSLTYVLSSSFLLTLTPHIDRVRARTVPRSQLNPGHRCRPCCPIRMDPASFFKTTHRTRTRWNRNYSYIDIYIEIMSFATKYFNKKHIGAQNRIWSHKFN